MTTRHDIPSRGTGAAPLATYYVVNLERGDVVPVSTPDALHDHLIKLVAVPPEVAPDEVGDYLANQDLWSAPSVADVIEFARRSNLHSTRPADPAVAAALAAMNGESSRG